jgi:CRP/FNR family cyclic AMP-dependent transcriptional regulator
MIRNLQNDPYKEALEKLLSFSYKKTYPANTAIIRIGDLGDKLYFILGGSATIFAEETGGRHELILAYLNKNDFIGEVGVFKGAEIYKVNVKTREPSQLAQISYERLHHLLKKELLPYAPDLLSILAEQLANRLLMTNRNLCDLAFMDVEGRIARTLLDLCKQPDAISHPDGMQLKISRQELSRIVSCSREMAGRILKELENKGLIATHGKAIIVLTNRLNAVGKD